MPTPHKHELGVHYIKERSKWSRCLHGPSPLNEMGSGGQWLEVAVEWHGGRRGAGSRADMEGTKEVCLQKRMFQ